MKPVLPIPEAGKELSGRPKDLENSKSSRCKKSKAKAAKPSFAQLRASSMKPRNVWSRVGEDEPQQDTPKAGDAEPILPRFRTEKHRPGCKKSKISIAGSRYAVLRAGAVEPRAVRSDTSSGKPTQAIPHSGNALPERAGMRGEGDEPELARLCGEGVNPRCKESSAGKGGSEHAMLLSNRTTPR